MKTEIITERDIEKAGRVIKNGGLVAFPTETVYGLGADGFNDAAVKKIYEAKGRPSDNPLILHVSDMEMTEKTGYINESAKKIIEKFWPGPLTVIVKKKDTVGDVVSAGLKTVAIRMPSNETARKLIESAGTPIAAPSANISGRPSPTRFDDVFADLDGRIDMIIKSDNSDIGIESTIVDTTSVPPMILRPGGITYEMSKEVLPDITEEKTAPHTGDFKPKCPGMKYKHYAPKAKVIVFEGNSREKIEEKLAENRKNGIKTGVFCKDGSEYECECIIHWGENAEDMAAKMFSALRDFDKSGVDEILCGMPEENGIGAGVRNRIYKSAGFDIR